MASQEEEVLGKAYDSRLMKRLLTYLHPYKLQVGISLVSILLKAGADVVQPILVMTAMDKYLAPVPGGHTFLDFILSADPYRGVGQLAGFYVAMLILSFLLEYLQIYFMQWTGQKAMFDLRTQIFRHLQRMHIGFYDKNPVGRLVTRVTSDVDALNDMFTSGVVSLVEDVFVLAGIVTIMVCVNWKLALITLSVLPLIAWATGIFRDRVRDSYRRIRAAVARINSHLQENVSGMMVLQLFNREERAFQEFSKVNALHMDAFKDAIWAHAVYYPVVEFLSAVAISSVIWFGGNDVIRGFTTQQVTMEFSRAGFFSIHAAPAVVTIGLLIAFIQYAQRFFRPIQDFSEKYNLLQAAMAASERIFKLLDSPVEITSPGVVKKPGGPGKITFEHVWFTYASNPSEPDWILKDVSFEIEAGETVAIVGHTGAGKTTIISLLMRFYDVQKGAIKIDGIDIKQMDLTDLRRRFGVVLQDPFLFTGTIESNIRLGTEWIRRDDVEKAAKEVNLADFVHSLPQGYNEEVRERGSTLSTGQKQLISFARALAHNPKILVLDEATSSVDTETEFRVRDALQRMVEGRTSVIIAHRLSTIQRADKIIVMHKGQLREMGSHQELLAARGIYYKLYQLQYKDQEIAVGTEVPAD
jgi:ATP-binding cassette subfamily B multidrug efflux pump